MNPSANTPQTIWLVGIEHRHGLNHYVAHTREQLLAMLAGYCREFWHELARLDAAADPSGMTDQEVVDVYFGGHDAESYLIDEVVFDDVGARVYAALRSLMDDLTDSGDDRNPETGRLYERCAHAREALLEAEPIYNPAGGAALTPATIRSAGQGLYSALTWVMDDFDDAGQTRGEDGTLFDSAAYALEALANAAPVYDPEYRAGGDSGVAGQQGREALQKLRSEHTRQRQALVDLLAWAQLMGGWDAPCWQRAAELLGGVEPTEDREFDRIAGDGR